MIPATALIVAMIPIAATAEPGIFGEWCGDEGQAIGIEAAGLGNFEHTFCAFHTPQTDGPVIDTAMTCRSTFWGGDGEPHVMNEFRTDFIAHLQEDGRLHVDYNDPDIAPFFMSRCEEF